jgi:hypothetical protein
MRAAAGADGHVRTARKDATMSSDRHETLSHSIESARPDVEIELEDERLDDDFDVATARNQEHQEEQHKLHPDDVPPTQ